MSTGPVIQDRSPELRGRLHECETLAGLLEAARGGGSQALVLRGEPGVGKTALLDYLGERASGCRVLRATGVQSEMELAFAALHQLLAPTLDHLERLPAPQRDALMTAFGVSAGPVPERFMVALAVLGLLSEVAEERPLLCLVDDEQWLDRASAQALAFVARRLDAESVGLVFAARVPSEELAGLPELAIEGLGEGDARALLDSVLPGPLDAQVREQIISETRGNPLALLELPRGMTHAELAGGFGLPGVVSLSGSIEKSFQRQFDAFPAETLRLLQLAAADPVGEPLLLWRAADRLDIAADAAAPAAEAGLIEFDRRVRFRHPLARSAAYRSASTKDRRAVHGALAEVTDPEVDPDRRAWHRAQAAPGPDEELAVELERSAGRAQARGGLAATAAFLERAAMLTPEPTARARRLLAAAGAKCAAGAPDDALGLLVAVEAGALDGLLTAELERLRGQIAFTTSRGRDAPPLLLDAARRLEGLDPRRARDAYLEAMNAARYAGRFAAGTDLREVARCASVAPTAPEPLSATDLLMDGHVAMFTQGYAAAVPTWRSAIAAFRSRDASIAEELRWLGLTAMTAVLMWDFESWLALSARYLELAREGGALNVLPTALNVRAGGYMLNGELAAAGSLVEELGVVCEATRTEPLPHARVMLAAWRGRETEASTLIEAATAAVVERGEGGSLTFIQMATAVLYNGLGRYGEALAAARKAHEHPEDLFTTWTVPELIEAAARSGETAQAVDALAELSQIAHVTGSGWALGIEARSRALLSEHDVAEGLYREAIERLELASGRVELARAHLLYGEWLRRESRRVDAREQLRTAHEMLAEMGLEAFAERARRELLATGEKVRERTVETRDELTAQEAQIARFARDGLSNPEIGARLFISPRTVKYHLHKVFIKLDITSRSQLEQALPSDPAAVSSP